MNPGFPDLGILSLSPECWDYSWARTSAQYFCECWSSKLCFSCLPGNHLTYGTISHAPVFFPPSLPPPFLPSTFILKRLSILYNQPKPGFSKVFPIVNWVPYYMRSSQIHEMLVKADMHLAVTKQYPLSNTTGCQDL